jgi:hypothetical protein
LEYVAPPGGGITLTDILETLRLPGIDGAGGFLSQIGIHKAGLTYDLAQKRFSGLLRAGGADLDIDFSYNEGFEYSAALKVDGEISLLDVPVVGEMVRQFCPALEGFSLSGITFDLLSSHYGSAEKSAGLWLTLDIYGETESWQLWAFEPRPQRPAAPGAQTAPEIPRAQALPDPGAPHEKIYWLTIEKSAAIFTLHRLGLALNGGRIGFMLDAGLSVSPLTLDLLGLGISVDAKDFSKIAFELSGIGISFASDWLTIAGSFMKQPGDGDKPDEYAGSLALRFGKVSAFAVGEYSDGSLMAYACIDAPIGGPPACFIKGLAAGFGYNRDLSLPDIASVASYPLIAGARGEISRSDLPAKLERYITRAERHNFLAAGIHFTSFEIADSFALLTVNFGGKLQIGILGLSDMTMPPNCKSDPVAHAQLELKATLTPDDGLFAVDALLTSESYILSRDCKLTGGFAFYLWFGGEHSGDFVITLGGYHPSFAKPAHYPSVPRVGFNWDVIHEHPGRLVISGELYFALTPSLMMAGGRLAAIYRDGNLRAWFIARADFLISWKPFYYDARVSISLGASYTVDLFFVQATASIELSCDLHIWGPDFSGTAHISWYIISFNISFGADAPQHAGSLDWEDFSRSFLPKAAPRRIPGGQTDAADPGNKVNPLNIAITKGAIGEGDGDGIALVHPEELELSFTTVFPCTTLSSENIPAEGGVIASASDDAAVLHIRPMGVDVKRSALDVNLILAGGPQSGAEVADAVPCVIKRNLPSALWAPAGAGDELVPDALCGVAFTFKPETSPLFPRQGFISEALLTATGALKRSNAFDFSGVWTLPDYRDEATVQVVTDTAAALNTEGRRFLDSLGYHGACDMTKFAAGASFLLDEDVFVGRIA